MDKPARGAIRTIHTIRATHAFRANRAIRALLAAALAAGTAHAGAQPVYDGWLCCSLRAEGDWINDINYKGNGARLIPAGTPVKITGHGRQRVKVSIGGEAFAIGNDYSRDLTPTEFTERYVLRQSPAPRMNAWPREVQDAVRTGRARRGMTREQVIAALGYPVSSENPNLDAPAWRYWLGSFEEFGVRFDKAGRVAEVTGRPETLLRVLVE